MKKVIFVLVLFCIFVKCNEAPQTGSLPVARKSTFVVSYIDKVKYTFQGYDSQRKVLITTQSNEQFAKPLLEKYKDLTEKSGVAAEYQYFNDTTTDGVTLILVIEKD